MSTYALLKKYEKQCVDQNTVLLRYIYCQVEIISSSVTKILKNFPYVKTFYWYCDGYCNLIEHVSGI